MYGFIKGQRAVCNLRLRVTDTLPYRFCPSSAGTYTIERKVRIYDVSIRLVTGIYKVSASVEMPDGTQMLLEEKEITRIKEDKSGLNTSNMREIGAPNITITVKDRQLDIDKKDFMTQKGFHNYG